MEKVPKGSKTSIRKHLEQVHKTIGKKPKELINNNPFPEELRYIWEWYLDVKNNDGITFTELRNWADLRAVELLSWEADIIKTLDRLYWRTIDG